MKLFITPVAVALALLGAGAPAMSGPLEGPGGRSLPVQLPVPSVEPTQAPMLPPPMFVLQGDTVRLEVALPPDAPFQERADAKQWRLVLPGQRPPAGLPDQIDPVLGGLKAKAEGNDTVLMLDWKYWCPTDVVWREGPTRITVTFRKYYKETQTEQLAPGVRHLHVRQADQNGPLDVHVLRADPRVPGVRVAPAMAGGEAMFARNTVSWIARRNGAIAGVNGAFFSPKTGEPLGLLVIDGKQISGPLFNRGALALGDRQSYVGNTQLTARLQVRSGESYDFDGVNQPRGLNRMVLYTRSFGISTLTQPGGTEMVVDERGVVTAVGKGDTTIPPKGMVLAAHGQAAEWLAKRVALGDKVKIGNPLADFWPGARHILGGGPTLLLGGEVVVDAAREHFQADIAQGIAPRTAVGITAEGEVLIMTVDGRIANISRGMSLPVLAKYMRDLGAVDAVNLDGGGSTAMAIGGQLVNHPSDGVERAVNNALLIYAPTP
ncbi:MAG: PhosphodieSPTER glycosidase [Cyanobacteria bacterium RYN_339]|nr:PhosphodieSPTER glycosidase [Cyanobacteria bacterium RYN_339]